MVQHTSDIEAAVASLGGVEHGLYAERWAPFVKASSLPGHCSGAEVA